MEAARSCAASAAATFAVVPTGDLSTVTQLREWRREAPHLPPERLEAILDLQASALRELAQLRDPGVGGLIADIEDQRRHIAQQLASSSTGRRSR
jgi:hypothetical protein